MTLKHNRSREGSAAAIIVVSILAVIILIAIIVAASNQRPQPTYQVQTPQRRAPTSKQLGGMNELGGKTMGQWMDGQEDSDQLKARKKRMGGRSR